MTRRAKIVATLGPASRGPERVSALVDAGMDVARLNFSHGERAEHAAACADVRAAAAAAGRAVAVLIDLQGPKIRLGTFAAGPVRLAAGDEFAITTEPVPGDRETVSTTYAGLPTDVAPGRRLLVDDGRVALEVTTVEGPVVRTRVVVGGMVSDHKGLNLPGTEVSAPALTDKDEDDLRFALGLPVDLVALSFVRRAADADAVRRIMAEVGADLPVIAKIEQPEAVDRLEEVVDAFDGIMVARGDLGVELALEQVPVVQKRAVRVANERARPVIVATQMLESMVSAPRPTRAEVSDVANAVLDGADALMLSAETSIGADPVAAVRTMASVIAAAEAGGTGMVPLHPYGSASVEAAIAGAAAEVATLVRARALVAFTMTGRTARRLARHRSPIPLLAFTAAPAVRDQLALSWGVEAFSLPPVDSSDAMVAQVDAEMRRTGRGAVGDRVVIVAGTPPGVAGNTNSVRVHRLGDPPATPG